MISSRTYSSLHYTKQVLNKVSFLRNDQLFIQKALVHPETRFIPFHDFYPFVESSTNTLLKLRGTPEVQSYLSDTVSAQLVFLGLLPSRESTFLYKARYQGTPTFALDVTTESELNSHLLNSSRYKKLGNYQDLNQLDTEESSLISQAKTYLHWLSTHKFCSLCGSPNKVIHAGTKLRCSNGLCSSNKTVSNVSFPRTDPVAITAIANTDFSKVLLCKSGAPRNKGRNMYACVSGFVEPGETVENAAAREVWEETGLNVDNVDVVVTQPWPFPNNLMLGCIARVNENQDISLTHDCELEDARWVDIKTMHTLLNNKEDHLGVLRDGKTNIAVPNAKTIAHLLLKHVVDRGA